VKILFLSNYTLNINGTLLARGTAADSIVFDQFDDKSLWHSIRIENVDAESDSSIFEYCRQGHQIHHLILMVQRQISVHDIFIRHKAIFHPGSTSWRIHFWDSTRSLSPLQTFPTKVAVT